MTIPPLTLYHSVSARSFRPLWALEELGLPYKLVMLDFPPRVHMREYLTTNPLGTVPTLEGDNVMLTESVAMCQYLVSRKPGTSLDVRPDETDFPLYLNMLHYGEATLTFPQTLVLRYQHFEAPEHRQPQVAHDYAKWFLARTRLLDHTLRDRLYTCAERFTMADISVGYALMLAEFIGLLNETSPVIQEYWRRLVQRPAYLRAQEAERTAACLQGVARTPAPAVRPYDRARAQRLPG